jgi:hypothetical protein
MEWTPPAYVLCVHDSVILDIKAAHAPLYLGRTNTQSLQFFLMQGLGSGHTFFGFQGPNF